MVEACVYRMHLIRRNLAEQLVGLGERVDDELLSVLPSPLALTWWSSSCGRPETTMAPTGAASQLRIQMGNADVNTRLGATGATFISDYPS